MILFCMVADITNKQKRNVEQLSVFVLPDEKRKVIIAAEKQNRSTSNFCKNIILKKIREATQ
jgi:hypothetical protein